MGMARRGRPEAATHRSRSGLLPLDTFSALHRSPPTPFSFSQTPGLRKAQTRLSEIWSDVAGPHRVILAHTDGSEARAPTLPRKRTQVYVLNPDINLSEAAYRTVLKWEIHAFMFTLCFFLL